MRTAPWRFASGPLTKNHGPTSTFPYTPSGCASARIRSHCWMWEGGRMRETSSFARLRLMRFCWRRTRRASCRGENFAASSGCRCWPKSGATTMRQQIRSTLRLPLLAEIRSDYDAAADSIDGVDAGGVLRGGVHYLERGRLDGERPAIDALADHIARLARN